MKVIYYCVLILAFGFLSIPNLLSQETRKMDNGTILYVKSSEPANEGVEICTLCADKSLKLNCALYLYNLEENVGLPVVLSKVQLKAIIENKDLKKIEALKLGKSMASPFYYNEMGKAITYVFKSGSSLSLLTFDNSQPGSSSLPQRMENRPSQAELEKIAKCLDDAGKKAQECLEGIPSHLTGDALEREELLCGAYHNHLRAKCVTTKNSFTINNRDEIKAQMNTSKH